MVTNPRLTWSRLLLISAVSLLICRSASVSVKDTPSRFDEASLLKEVFGEDESDESKGPMPNTRRHEPTLQHDQSLDNEPDHGQVEGPDLTDQLLEEERAYFLTRDHDGDGSLSKDEFIQQINDIVDPIIDSGRPPLHPPPLLSPEDPSPPLSGAGAGTGTGSAIAAAAAALPVASAPARPPRTDRKGPLPGRDALLYGKDWTARVPAAQGEAAFREFDRNGDGKVGWTEWAEAMFHETPQSPKYRDGRRSRIADLSGLRDDEVNPEDIASMQTSFREFDADKSGTLNLEEVFSLVKSAHATAEDAALLPPAEPAAAEEEFAGGRVGDGDLMRISAEMVSRMDRNNDTALTLEEWVDGGGY